MSDRAGLSEDAHAESDTAAVGLALLPFLGAGHIHTQPSRYQQVVQHGLDWLVANQQKSGELYLGGSHNGEFYSHAIASMALCEGLRISKDKRLAEPAQRAIDFLIQTQNKDDGGWRYFVGQPGDTSVVGWQMFALRKREARSLNVPKNVFRGCSHFLDLAGCDKHRTTYRLHPGIDESEADDDRRRLALPPVSRLDSRQPASPNGCRRSLG